MKIAKIYPKCKKGDENDPTNYRPVSTLPTISKSLEKVVHNQIIEHLERNDFISNCQHGFQKERSTQTAISTIREDITSIWEEKKHVSCLFLDMKKAFNTLDWEMLKINYRTNSIYKSQCNGLNHWLPCWQISICRSATKTGKQAKSVLKLISKSIPQGSILLGPHFLNIPW